MAGIRHADSFVTSMVVMVACTFFLWMFFAAATLERTADLGRIAPPPGRDARVAAYEFAARWRHGMADNSPIYMPGFFAVAIATWFWSTRKGLRRMIAEGLVLLVAAAICAALLAPYTAPRIASAFIAQEHFNVSDGSSSATWISVAQGIYSLITWSTVIIAARWSIKQRSLKPLLIPLVLNVVLAFVRPWTVADFTSRWAREAVEGEPVAVISFLLIPIISGIMAWVEIRPWLRKIATRKRGCFERSRHS